MSSTLIKENPSSMVRILGMRLLGLESSGKSTSRRAMYRKVPQEIPWRELLAMSRPML